MAVTYGVEDHGELTGIGTLTHVQIETALAGLQHAHLVLTDSPGIVAGGDRVIFAKPVVAADFAISLPSSPQLTHGYTIVWAIGDPDAACTEFLTVTDPDGRLINGKSSYVFSVYRGLAVFYYDGSEWSAS